MTQVFDKVGSASAETDEALRKTLHGWARLHVHLGRMDGENISTRGWSYNELVEGALYVNGTTDASLRQHRAVETVFDALDGMTEIGAKMIEHFNV